MFIAVFISNFLDEFATKSKSQSSSGFFRFIVGGAWLSLMDKIEKIDSIAPAAPSVCPVIDFVELTIGGFLNTDFIALHSARSPKGVDVA